jgi:putative phage-type endonuclease
MTSATAEMTWLQERRTGIGGSDAAAVVGLSKWRTPLQVYQDKVGEACPIPESEPMRWGKILEPVLRQEYSNQTGREVLLPEGIIRKPDAPYMLANLDGYTLDDRVVELKTARTGEGWGDATLQEVPTEYLIQVQHYMAVTGLPVADIAVLIGGSDFRIYEIPADVDLQQSLAEAELMFWERVEQQRPPDALTMAEQIKSFKAYPGEVRADDEVLALVAELRQVGNRLKEMAEHEANLKQHIQIYMAERDTLLDNAGNVLATWKEAKPTVRLDSKALKAEAPEIYEKYSTVGEATRRFLLKGA